MPTPTVPGAPRTETVLYGSGRCLTAPAVRDPLDGAREVAVRVLHDDVSVDSVQLLALAEAIEELDLRLITSNLQRATALSLAAEYQARLLECRALLAEQQTLRASALADANQQRTLAIRLSEQVCTLVRPSQSVAAYQQWDTSDVDTVVCAMEGVTL